jgi:3-hydroxyisobutyrate dehydrogenase-like beta-hydroxyacid dehydrogenase
VTVSLLGLGPMDAPMAANLVRTLVVHGTVSPVAMQDLAADRRREHGVRVVDAPMSGGAPGADRGALRLMVGGDPADVDPTGAPSERTALLHEQFRRMVACGGGDLDHSGLLRTVRPRS